MADALDASPTAELILRPELGVVLFRRSGWAAPEWRGWAERLLRDGIAFVAPSTYRGEPVGRVGLGRALGRDGRDGGVGDLHGDSL